MFPILFVVYYGQKQSALRALIATLFVSILLSSCGVYLVDYDRIESMTKEFKGKFLNVPDGSVRGHTSPTLVQMFNIGRPAGDTIWVELLDSSLLRITYIDTALEPGSNKRVVTRKGKLSKNGYFQLYLREERTEIPPAVPILFGRKDIDRLRIAYTKDGFLAVDRYRTVGGNVFFLYRFRTNQYHRFFGRIE